MTHFGKQRNHICGFWTFHGRYGRSLFGGSTLVTPCYWASSQLGLFAAFTISKICSISLLEFPFLSFHRHVCIPVFDPFCCYGPVHAACTCTKDSYYTYLEKTYNYFEHIKLMDQSPKCLHVKSCPSPNWPQAPPNPISLLNPLQPVWSATAVFLRKSPQIA